MLCTYKLVARHEVAVVVPSDVVRVWEIGPTVTSQDSLQLVLGLEEGGSLLGR